MSQIRMPDFDDSAWDVPDFTEDICHEKRHNYALVIPVINEGDRFRDQLRRICAADLLIDVVIADGGSTDNSTDLDFIRAEGGRAVLTKTGPGKLSAQLRMAYAWCIRQGYAGMVTIDGNGKDGVEAVADMVAKLGQGYDYVQGSRYLKGGRAENTPIDRVLAGRLVHAPLLSLASGHFFTDTTNGFRAYSTRYLTDPRVAPFREVFSEYNLLFYLTVRANQLGFRCTELPVHRSYPTEGRTPTKISGAAGRFRLANELLRSAFGGYRPTELLPVNTRERALDNRNSWFGVAALALVSLFLLISRLLLFGESNDPGTDESMLIANFPLSSLGATLEPLPLFEQAGPFGYIFSVNALAHLFSDTTDLIMALRQFSVVAGLASIFLIYLSIRRNGNWAVYCLVLALSGFPPGIISYGFEIKHYIFEHLAMSMMLFAGSLAALGDKRRNIIFFGMGGLFSVLFSFTAPIIIGAVGIGTIVQRWVYAGISLRDGWLIRFGATLTLLALVFLAYYFGYSRVVMTYQLAGYANVYDGNMLPFPPDRSWLRLPYILTVYMTETISANMVWSVPFAVLFLIGIVATARTFILIPVTFFTAVVLIYGLSLAGLFPISTLRHFIFMAPVVAIILGFGLFTVLKRFAQILFPKGGELPIFAGCIAVVAAVGALGTLKSKNYLQKPNVSKLIDKIQAGPNADRPVWVYHAAQPVMRVIAPSDVEQIGILSHKSQVPGWIFKARNYPNYDTSQAYFDEFRRSIRGRGPMWFVFTHFWTEREGLGRFRSIAEEEVGACEEYVDESSSVLWYCSSTPR